MAGRIEAPFTDTQVAALNAWQADQTRHPFTCGGDRSDAAHAARAEQAGEEPGLLVATTDGWRCPACGYAQGWAHSFMASVAA